MKNHPAARPDGQEEMPAASGQAEAPPDLLARAEEVALEYLEQIACARDCLDLILDHWASGQTDGLPMFGYALQHNEHMQRANELARVYVAAVHQASQEAGEGVSE
jgi:hypothetical protein